MYVAYIYHEQEPGVAFATGEGPTKEDAAVAAWAAFDDAYETPEDAELAREFVRIEIMEKTR